MLLMFGFVMDILSVANQLEGLGRKKTYHCMQRDLGFHLQQIRLGNVFNRWMSNLRGSSFNFLIINVL
jgi:hypothetical protein